MNRLLSTSMWCHTDSRKGRDTTIYAKMKFSSIRLIGNVFECHIRTLPRVKTKRKKRNFVYS